jgi:hypothetical protein
LGGEPGRAGGKTGVRFIYLIPEPTS